MYIGVCIHINSVPAEARKGHWRSCITGDCELEMVLGRELGSSARAICAVSTSDAALQLLLVYF